jgi:ELWxxDGT repeat protein
VHGRELWKSDGTAEGTVLLADTYPLLADSGPNSLTRVGQLLFLTTPKQVWRSDGTQAGTFPVFSPPGNGGWGAATGSLGSAFFFVHHTSASGLELWRSDGTPEGTGLFKDLNPGPGGSMGSAPMVQVGNSLFFNASDGIHGQELWKSDGTPEGTQRVADIAPGLAAGISPSYNTTGAPLRVIGDAVYFAADDGVHGMELWKSDGTAEGTTLLRELTPGAAGSALQSLSIVPAGPHGTFAFAASSAAGGLELWRSDGTTEGTWPLYATAPGTPVSSPSLLTVSGSRLFFVADDGEHGRELWSVKQAAFNQRP